MNISKLLQASAMSLIVASLVVACGPKTRESSKRPGLRGATDKPAPNASPTQTATNLQTNAGTPQQQQTLLNASFELGKAIEKANISENKIDLIYNNEEVTLQLVTDIKPFADNLPTFKGTLSSGKLLVAQIIDKKGLSTRLQFALSTNGNDIIARTDIIVTDATLISLATLKAEPKEAEKAAVEALRSKLETSDLHIQLVKSVAGPEGSQIGSETITVESEAKSFGIKIHRNSAKPAVYLLSGLDAQIVAEESNYLNIPNSLLLSFVINDQTKTQIELTLKDAKATPEAPEEKKADEAPKADQNGQGSNAPAPSAPKADAKPATETPAKAESKPAAETPKSGTKPAIAAKTETKTKSAVSASKVSSNVPLPVKPGFENQTAKLANAQSVGRITAAAYTKAKIVGFEMRYETFLDVTQNINGTLSRSTESVITAKMPLSKASEAEVKFARENKTRPRIIKIDRANYTKQIIGTRFERYEISLETLKGGHKMWEPIGKIDMDLPRAAN